MKRHGVIFRVGTPARFVWKRIGPFETRGQAVEKAKDHETRDAKIVDFDLSVAIGLPEDSETIENRRQETRS
jgi:hypothetical protein